MDFFNLIFDHFWEVVIFLVLFGGSIGGALRWLISQSYKHHEAMQEKYNEKLRLQLQLEQARNERLALQKTPRSSDPLPKDASWDDQVQSTYEMGYQQIQIQQPS